MRLDNYIGAAQRGIHCRSGADVSVSSITRYETTGIVVQLFLLIISQVVLRLPWDFSAKCCKLGSLSFDLHGTLHSFIIILLG